MFKLLCFFLKRKLQQRTVKNPDQVTEQGRRTKYEKYLRDLLVQQDFL